MYSEQFHLDPHVQRRNMSTSLIVLHTIDHGLLTSVYSPRVIHAMRTWLSYSFDDFKDERLRKKLQEFLKIVQMWVNHLIFHATCACTLCPTSQFIGDSRAVCRCMGSSVVS